MQKQTKKPYANTRQTFKSHYRATQSHHRATQSHYRRQKELKSSILAKINRIGGILNY